MGVTGAFGAVAGGVAPATPAGATATAVEATAASTTPSSTRDPIFQPLPNERNDIMTTPGLFPPGLFPSRLGHYGLSKPVSSRTAGSWSRVLINSPTLLTLSCKVVRQLHLEHESKALSESS